MPHVGRLRIRVRDAEVLAKSLSPDDPEWCRCWAEGDVLNVEVRSEKVGAILNALDDYLLNLKAAFNVLKVIWDFEKP